jgi:hypothetical protein
MASFTQRLIGAARLDVATYEEIEADSSALGQAMLVVALSAVAAGIGGLGRHGIIGAVSYALAALAGWFLWAALTWLIGTKLLPEPETHADIGQLLRTTGFSAGPGLLRVVTFIPLLGWLVRIVAEIWMLVAMVVAVRQALDYRSTGRAVIVCIIGFVVNIAVVGIVAAVFGLKFGGIPH